MPLPSRLLTAIPQERKHRAASLEELALPDEERFHLPLYGKPSFLFLLRVTLLYWRTRSKLMNLQSCVRHLDEVYLDALSIHLH